MNFTSHSIMLNNGETTRGSNEILLSDSNLWKSIEKTVNLFMPKTAEERSKLRVVDLGCLEGSYSVQFARMGFDVLGIEAREENIKKCNYVKTNLNLPNLNFVQDDVRNVTKYGKFDIALCYGLLYHLNDPYNFLNILNGCTNKILLLNTHYAPERDIRYSLGGLNNYFIAPIQKRTRFLEYQKNFRLSRITQNEGYRGRWYKEWNENEEKDKIEKSLWASYNNYRSFWLCKKELVKAIHNVGFNSVFEQFDFTGVDTTETYIDYLNRSMFVAIKH